MKIQLSAASPAHNGRGGVGVPSSPPPGAGSPAPFLIWGTLASTHHSPREREQLPTQSASRALYTYTYTDTYHCRVSTRSYRVLRFVNAYIHYSFTEGDLTLNPKITDKSVPVGREVSVFLLPHRSIWLRRAFPFGRRKAIPSRDRFGWGAHTARGTQVHSATSLSARRSGGDLGHDAT